MSDERRNLNPHAEARVAMALYSNRYARQSGGSMDFWDSLSPGEQSTCKQIVDGVLQAERADGSPPAPAEAKVDAVGEIDSKALADAEFHVGKMVHNWFVTTTAGDGKPYVKITCQCLEDVHLFVDGLRGLKAWYDARAALSQQGEKK